METTDYAEAVAKAQKILNQPLLNITEGFKPGLDDSRSRTANGPGKSRESKYSVLLMFGEDEMSIIHLGQNSPDMNGWKIPAVVFIYVNRHF